MKAHSWWTRAALLAMLALALTGVPVLAQEDEEPETMDGMGAWFFELGTWVAQPTGLDLTPATRVNPYDVFDHGPVSITPSTDSRFRYRTGLKLRRNMGEVILTWFSHQDRSTRSETAPGQFVFGETLVTPLYSGVFYNGMADAFDAESFLKTRDLRLDYYRTAYTSDRISVKWFVGYRRVSHHRRLSANYYALVPGLPALVPPLTNPRSDLDPGTDVARMASDVSVRGGEFGAEVKMPLLAGKVWLNAGASVGLLRGRASTEYFAQTYRYVFLDSDGVFDRVAMPPYDEFDDFTGTPGENDFEAVIDDVQQQQLNLGFRSNNESINSQSLEMFLELRWKAWKDIELFAGYRSARFPNMGVELRQTEVIPVNLDPEPGAEPTFNIPAPERVEHDLNYEGYFAGVAYSF